MLNSPLSFLIRCSQTGKVWLFNCPDGCQQILDEHHIKINQINYIILTSLKTQVISGLMGLLSSLSLNGHIHDIHLYGPPGVTAYLNLARKYSQTTFRYRIQIHISQQTHIYKCNQFYIYTYPINKWGTCIAYVFLEQEKKGRFQETKAKTYKLMPGPIYGNLKLHKKYILPDGTIISGKHFTYTYSQGIKIFPLAEYYGYRFNYELIDNTRYIIAI
uniref:Ribonuclease Z n=1 Tax=Hommersandiophycus borowitzkae TaxID=268573 RepID=A0A1G4NTW4_9FLOR|nr:Ribonuclease Z [Hommersandiophycus borowitzkae]SCW22077.1 Ribonuclease Z [Hommersandiophycus borowitzkae]